MHLCKACQAFAEGAVGSLRSRQCLANDANLRFDVRTQHPVASTRHASPIPISDDCAIPKALKRAEQCSHFPPRQLPSHVVVSSFVAIWGKAAACTGELPFFTDKSSPLLISTIKHHSAPLFSDAVTAITCMPGSTEGACRGTQQTSRAHQPSVGGRRPGGHLGQRRRRDPLG